MDRFPRQMRITGRRSFGETLSGIAKTTRGFMRRAGRSFEFGSTRILPPPPSELTVESPLFFKPDRPVARAEPSTHVRGPSHARMTRLALPDDKGVRHLPQPANPSIARKGPHQPSQSTIPQEAHTAMTEAPRSSFCGSLCGSSCGSPHPRSAPRSVARSAPRTLKRGMPRISICEAICGDRAMLATYSPRPVNGSVRSADYLLPIRSASPPFHLVRWWLLSPIHRSVRSSPPSPVALVVFAFLFPTRRAFRPRLGWSISSHSRQARHNGSRWAVRRRRRRSDGC